jgi:cytochrome c-type biogenesis protein CcmH
MLFFLVVAALTLVVAAVLIRPLLRDLPEPAAPDRYNAAVYRDQLKELQRDAERDALPASDVMGARVEIERRLLATAREGRAQEAGAVRRAPIASAFVLLAVLVLGAGAIYITVGSPTAPDHPFKRQAGGLPSAALAPGADGMHTQMDQMVQSLQKKLAANPNDADGWGLLARSLMRLDRAAEAVPAYQRAIAASSAPNAQLDAEYAEARVIAANGQVDDGALALFNRLNAADPKNPQARYYIALAKAQKGDTRGALADWRALQADSPKDAPWLPTLQQRIADVSGPSAAAAPTTPVPTSAPAAADGAGPTAADMQAASSLSDADRQKMIEGMVDRLAARIKESPDDVDGWRRLAQAYTVEGRTSEAAAAERQVLRLDPSDPNAKAVLGVP